MEENRKYVATFTQMTHDIWDSVTASMCLQAQCLLCCCYSFKRAGAEGSIDIVIVQISRERRLYWFDGVEWVKVGLFTSGAVILSLDDVTSIVNAV